MLRKIRTVRSFSTKFAKYAKLRALPVTVATIIASCGNDNLQNAEDNSSGLKLESNKNSTEPSNIKPGTTMQNINSAPSKNSSTTQPKNVESPFSKESSTNQLLTTNQNPNGKNDDPLNNPPVVVTPDSNNENNNRTKPNTSPKADAVGNSNQKNNEKAGVLIEDFVDNIGNDVEDVLRNTEKIGENTVRTVIDTAKGGLTIATDIVEDGIYEIENFAGVDSPKFADTNLRGDLKNIGNKLGNDIGNIAKSTVNLGADVVGDTLKIAGDLAMDTKNDAKYVAAEVGLGNMSFSNDDKKTKPGIAPSSSIKRNTQPTKDKLPLTTPSNKSGEELQRHNRSIVKNAYPGESEEFLNQIYENPIVKKNEIFENSDTIAAKLMKYSAGGYDTNINHMLVSVPLQVKDSNGDFKDRGVNIADINLENKYKMSSQGNSTWLEVKGKFLRKVQNDGKLEFAWGDDIRDMKIKLNLQQNALKAIEKGLFGF